MIVTEFIKETINRHRDATYSNNSFLISKYKIKSYRSGYYIIQAVRERRANSNNWDEIGEYYLISENNIKIQNNEFRIDRENIIPIWKVINSTTVEALAA